MAKIIDKDTFKVDFSTKTVKINNQITVSDLHKYLNDLWKREEKNKLRKNKLNRITGINFDIDDNQPEPFVASGTISFNQNLINDRATSYKLFMDEWVELETKEEKAKKQREKRLKKLDRIVK